jgi:hypothetical protein
VRPQAAFSCLPSELQTCLARRIGNRTDTPVVQETASIEDDALDALVDGPLRDRLANRLCPFAARASLANVPDARLDARKPALPLGRHLARRCTLETPCRGRFRPRIRLRASTGFSGLNRLSFIFI